MDAGQHAEKKEKRFSRSAISLVVMVAIIFGLSFLLRQYVIQGYSIPSGSMETTIMTGDTVFAEQVSFRLRPIEQGDIVVFQDPEYPSRILIKRVIAVGGQKVSMEDGILYIDGTAQTEKEKTYVRGSTNRLQRTIADIGPLTNAQPFTVPQDTIWVMGDNRENSQDSRYFGPIKVSSVYGRAFMVYWPLEHFGVLQ
ncbi:MAG: signal peptidase I [Coriobacteriaceae bacterium]|jgi:signal peptidase I|nr:signal peptidase I [Coriobacteriaceae bacterium]